MARSSESRPIGLLALLRRRREFRRLWTGEVVSYAGDWLTYVAVAVLALQTGEGLVALAMVLVVHSLPHALIAPVAGVLTDRLDRRKVLVGAAVVQGVLALGMAAAAWAGALVLLQGLLLARVAVAAFFVPAQTAAVARLVEREEIQTANALASATWSVMFAVGVGLGGVVAALLGPTLAILVDAVTFGIAAIILLPLPAMRPLPGASIPGAGEQGSLGAAWAIARRSPRLLEAVLAKTPLALAGGGAWVLLNQRADMFAIFGSAALTLGIVQAVRGIGTGVGPFVLARVQRRWSEGFAWGLSAIATFAGVALLPFATGVWTLGAVALLWGMGIGANWVATTSRMQREADDAVMGRLASIDFLTFTAGSTVSALAGALLGDALALPEAAAWLALALGLGSWLLLRWYTRRSAVRTGAPGALAPAPAAL